MPEIGEIKKGNEIGYVGRKHFIWHACEGCGKCSWVQITRGILVSHRCRSCAGKHRVTTYRGENSWLWKGGQTISQKGYLMIYLQPDDFFYKMANRSGYVFEHRLVVAKALGRNLHSWEIVHHKHDKYPAGSVEDKQDNRYPENLQLVSDDRHKQITILEGMIKNLQKRVTLLEAENILLKEQISLSEYPKS